MVDGQTLTIEVDGSTLRDAQTGTTWTLAGEAVRGPLEGTVLDGVPHSDPFWFAWAAFYPDTALLTR